MCTFAFGDTVVRKAPWVSAATTRWDGVTIPGSGDEPDEAHDAVNTIARGNTTDRMAILGRRGLPYVIVGARWRASRSFAEPRADCANRTRHDLRHVTAAVGFGSAESMRQEFLRVLGQSPREHALSGVVYHIRPFSRMSCDGARRQQGDQRNRPRPGAIGRGCTRLLLRFGRDLVARLRATPAGAAPCPRVRVRQRHSTRARLSRELVYVAEGGARGAQLERLNGPAN